MTHRDGYVMHESSRPFLECGIENPQDFIFLSNEVLGIFVLLTF